MRRLRFKNIDGRLCKKKKCNKPNTPEIASAT